MSEYNKEYKPYKSLCADHNDLRKNYEKYKSTKSEFKELKMIKLNNGKDLTISLKTNSATGERSLSIAQSIEVLKDDKPMRLYLKNALTLDKEQAKDIALILLKNC